MRVSEKGQITIPKDLRDALGFGAGSEVEFERADEGILLKKVAGKVFLDYRRNQGPRPSALPDFFIGAHAAVAELTLLTRDTARYRTYFPTVELIAPT